MCFGLALSPIQAKGRKVTLAFLVYVALVGLGMSKDISYLNLIGLLHALTAICIAVVCYQYIQNIFSSFLFVPCALIVFIVCFNLLNDSMGLTLMGRWM
jgi:hypothetical protein